MTSKFLQWEKYERKKYLELLPFIHQGKLTITG